MRSVSPRTRCGVQCGSKDQVPLPVFLDTASKRGMTGKSPRTTMRGPAREQGSSATAGISGYRVEARYDGEVTPHHDAGSREGPQRTSATVGISGYRVEARYDGEVTPRSMRGPVREQGSSATAGISGYRVEARYDGEVTPHHDAGSSEGARIKCHCRYFWIPRRSAV